MIERGTGAIERLLSFMLFNILPTFLEIAMVTAILWGMFDFWFAAVDPGGRWSATSPSP